MTVRVGQIPDLVDRKNVGGGVVVKPSAQGCIAVEGGEFAEHLAGGSEEDGVTADERLVSDIASKCRFPDAVGADKDDVGGIVHEGQGHQILDGGAVDAARPVPVIIGQLLEVAEPGGTHASPHRTVGALLFLPLKDGGQPVRVSDFVPMGDQAIEAQRLGPVEQDVEVFRVCNLGVGISSLNR